MPHFHFNLAATDGYYSADEQGVFFETLDAAYLDAHRAVLDISFEMLRARRDPSQHRFEIANEVGVVVLDVLFSEVLYPGRKASRMRLPDHFHDDVRREIRRSRELKADLSKQIAMAHRTIEETRQVLSRAGAAMV